MTILSYVKKKNFFTWGGSLKSRGLKGGDFIKDDSLGVVKILSNDGRYAIMKLLLGTETDLCVNEISELLGMSQSATSHQLGYLEARGIVRSIRHGRMKCYVPTNSALAVKLGQVIKSLK